MYIEDEERPQPDILKGCVFMYKIYEDFKKAITEDIKKMLEEVGIQRDERGFTWIAYDLMEHEEQLIEAKAPDTEFDKIYAESEKVSKEIRKLQKEIDKRIVERFGDYNYSAFFDEDSFLISIEFSSNIIFEIEIENQNEEAS